MIIVRTPYRVSFFGGGTDYPSWFREHGGVALTTTLDKYCTILARFMPPFLGSKYRVSWSKTEAVDSIAEITHPAVRGCLQFLGIEDGIEVNHAGDLPAHSGLGSSSSFTVGFLHALHALRGEFSGPQQLADEAIRVEQEVLREAVGVQDQIECAFGGLNLIQIEPSGNYRVSPVVVSSTAEARLESHLLLFFTGLQRYASDIAASQISNFQRKQRELKIIMRQVPDALDNIVRGDCESFGNLLHENWMLKRELSDKVSSPKIDDIYSRARSAGAWGGKILGAGGGGFMLFCVPIEAKPAVREALGDLLEVPFKFGRQGSRVVLYEPT